MQSINPTPFHPCSLLLSLSDSRFLSLSLPPLHSCACGFLGGGGGGGGGGLVGSAKIGLHVTRLFSLVDFPVDYVPARPVSSLVRNSKVCDCWQAISKRWWAHSARGRNIRVPSLRVIMINVYEFIMEINCAQVDQFKFWIFVVCQTSNCLHMKSTILKVFDTVIKYCEFNG